MSEFEYFDGREWAGDEVLEYELHAVDITENVVELSAGRQRIRHRPQIEVEPPTRAVYPRRLESIDEATELYVDDELSVEEFERYLEALLDADQKDVDL